ncbi:MAG TPA: NADH-quinone oxidoreductase subunit J [Polyangiaceae bacterium]|nr:NADH-quinone oxidoreductase subunit J [Polyangiaceae bacterium]
MSAGDLLFALCAVACLAGAITTVSAQNPIRGAMGLLTTIIGIAGLFLKLRAEFLTAIQLIVYAGAVVVLFVFVLMLLGADARAPARSGRSGPSRALGGGLFAVMSLLALISAGSGTKELTPFRGVSPGHGSVEAVGTELFSKGIFAFELATALLIVAVIGAIAVARSRQGAVRGKKVIRSPRDLFAGPVHPRDAGRPLADGGRPLRTEGAE